MDEVLDGDGLEVDRVLETGPPVTGVGSLGGPPPTAAAVPFEGRKGPHGGRRGSDKSLVGVLPAQARVLRSIIQSLPDGVIVVDPAGRFLLINPAAQRIIGPGPYDVSLAEWPRAYGWFFPDSVTPYPGEMLPLARALRGEVVADAELFVRNEWVPKGVWLSASSSPWKEDQAGASCGGVLVLRDITERKKSSDTIQRLSSAVEQTADSVFITDMEGTIVYVNPAFEQVTGYSPGEALGRTPRLLKSGKHEAAFYRQLWDTVLAGRVFRGVVMNRRKNGQLFHCEQTITPIRAADGRETNLVSVARDITERREAEHQQIEMDLARVVQQRLYPRTSVQVPGFDVGGAVCPAEMMCGDYFDHFPMPNDCLGLAVGDVSGHGVGPSLIMAQTRAYLRSLALTTSVAGEVLRQVNEILVTDLVAERYVTLVLVRLDRRASTLAYANAGHPPGYLLDRRGEVREVLGSTGTPLGLFAGGQFGSSRVIALEPGEIVVLLTDGITESGGYDGGSEYGAERALEFIRNHRHEAASEIANGLCRAARDFAPHGPQVDDMTVLICKVSSAFGAEERTPRFPEAASDASLRTWENEGGGGGSAKLEGGLRDAHGA